jgi:hypothetical protein
MQADAWVSGVAVLNGLWTIELSTSAADMPGGVFIFQKGRIYGGNSGFFYVGNYITECDVISAKVEVINSGSASSPVFGSSKISTLILSGRIQAPNMELTGRLSAKPALKIFLNCTKQADIHEASGEAAIKCTY